LIGVASLYFFHDLSGELVPRALWVWWLGDLLGVFLIAPLLLTSTQSELLPRNQAARIEGLVMLLGILSLTLLMMHYARPLRPAELVIFVLLPFVLWSALRFSATVTSLTIFLSGVIVLAVVVITEGGIDQIIASRDVLALQVSLITLALGGLFVSAALTERRYSEMRLDVLANHDPLTGLPNRAYFQDFLGHTLARAQRERYQVSLLFIDLDRFKNINDSQGHEVGDQVLRIVASRLDEQLRADDFVARLGGDEFAVILIHPPTPRAASRVAQKLTTALSEPFKLKQRRYAIGASIGISVYPDDGEDANTLLRQADLAMYQAKQRRTGFEYFNDGMNAAAQQQLTLETGLRQALDRGELALLYQPKIDLDSGRVVGLEALLRWLTRSGNIVGAGPFHSGGGGNRLDRADRTLGGAYGLHAVDRVETGGARTPGDRRQSLAAAVFRCAADRRHRDGAGGNQHARRIPATGNHRERGDGESCTYLRDARRPARTRTACLHRRFRHRPFQSRPAQAYADRCGENRQELHQGCAERQGRCRNRRRHHPAVTCTQYPRRRRRRGNPEQVAFLKEHQCDEIQGYVIAKPLPPDKVSALFAQIFSF
jgi:diguanylate cyclase (GGDEF)-like protein